VTGILKTRTTFWEMAQLPSSGEGQLLKMIPLERAEGVDTVAERAHKTFCSRFYNKRRWAECRGPVLLNVIHDHQGLLELIM
jgi:hypothetical protein